MSDSYPTTVHYAVESVNFSAELKPLFRTTPEFVKENGLTIKHSIDGQPVWMNLTVRTFEKGHELYYDIFYVYDKFKGNIERPLNDRHLNASVDITESIHDSPPDGFPKTWDTKILKLLVSEWESFKKPEDRIRQD
jgi:hypothetical protein